MNEPVIFDNMQDTPILNISTATNIELPIFSTPQFMVKSNFWFPSFTGSEENIVESNPLLSEGKKLMFDPKAFVEYKPYSLFHDGKIVVMIKINGKIITYYIEAN